MPLMYSERAPRVNESRERETSARRAIASRRNEISKTKREKQRARLSSPGCLAYGEQVLLARGWTICIRPSRCSPLLHRPFLSSGTFRCRAGSASERAKNCALIPDLYAGQATKGREFCFRFFLPPPRRRVAENGCRPPSSYANYT